ncbi:MAG: citrate synthase [Bdellovibrionaceae bacterium]|nr:citrate synthase [Pseudobdellovibrionaceae bacterium]
MQKYEGAMDRGLEGVVACSTAVSSIIDATLFYRGFTIEDLAAHSSFEEVIFLLWNNRLPDKEELQVLQQNLLSNMSFSDAEILQLKALPVKEVHPMAWLRTAISVLALLDPKSQSTQKEDQLFIRNALTGKMLSLVALFNCLRQGRDLLPIQKEYSMAWNFLNCLQGEEPTEEQTKVFDTCLILHADHSLNCSTFTARVTASSLSDMYSSIVSAIGALKGPLHGGANEEVLKTLKDIGSVDNVEAWLKNALANKYKIMGFGHRVYKNGDPRAKVLKSMSQSLCEKSGNAHLFEMSNLLESLMKKEKNILPNVDFYSATVYYSLGITSDLFTPIFAASRISGWLAHILEQWEDNRIYRPKGQWRGKAGQLWKPFDQR